MTVDSGSRVLKRPVPRASNHDRPDLRMVSGDYSCSSSWKLPDPLYLLPFSLPCSLPRLLTATTEDGLMRCPAKLIREAFPFRAT